MHSVAEARKTENIRSLLAALKGNGTQEDLARSLGVSPSAVSKWLRGEVINLGNRVRNRLQALLQCDRELLEELLEGTLTFEEFAAATKVAVPSQLLNSQELLNRLLEGPLAEVIFVYRQLSEYLLQKLSVAEFLDETQQTNQHGFRSSQLFVLLEASRINNRMDIDAFAKLIADRCSFSRDIARQLILGSHQPSSADLLKLGRYLRTQYDNQFSLEYLVQLKDRQVSVSPASEDNKENSSTALIPEVES